MQANPLQGRIAHRPGALADLAAAIAGWIHVDAARYRALEALADAHAVLPLLRERALGAGPAHDAALGALRDAALREAALEARRNAALADCLGALAAAGVPSLVFKGGALAHTLYARPELRPRDDTDLLVRESDLPGVERVLQRQGFARIPGVEGSLTVRQRLYRKVDADGLAHDLDVHWRLTNEPLGDAFRTHALLTRSRPLDALSPCALAPCPVDALLVACLHLDAHHAAALRLVWLWDVHLLAGALTAGDRRTARDRAGALGLQAACGWVLEATRATFGTDLRDLDGTPGARRATTPLPPRARRALRDLARLPDTGHRIRWIGQHLFPSVDYMRRRDGSNAPAWRLYARRALRGFAHLLGR